jgi:hypothetical protein
MDFYAARNSNTSQPTNTSMAPQTSTTERSPIISADTVNAIHVGPATTATPAMVNALAPNWTGTQQPVRQVDMPSPEAPAAQQPRLADALAPQSLDQVFAKAFGAPTPVVADEEQVRTAAPEGDVVEDQLVAAAAGLQADESPKFPSFEDTLLARSIQEGEQLGQPVADQSIEAATEKTVAMTEDPEAQPVEAAPAVQAESLEAAEQPVELTTDATREMIQAVDPVVVDREMDLAAQPVTTEERNTMVKDAQPLGYLEPKAEGDLDAAGIGTEVRLLEDDRQTAMLSAETQIMDGKEEELISTYGSEKVDRVKAKLQSLPSIFREFLSSTAEGTRADLFAEALQNPDRWEKIQELMFDGQEPDLLSDSFLDTLAFGEDNPGYARASVSYRLALGVMLHMDNAMTELLSLKLPDGSTQKVKPRWAVTDKVSRPQLGQETSNNLELFRANLKTICGLAGTDISELKDENAFTSSLYRLYTAVMYGVSVRQLMELTY